jgi:S-DNA-T family DNA segregation ATPase FtsK/SpoIIIE
MSDYRISSESGRILPGGLENELQRLPMRAVGVALLAVAAIGWLSLLTWSISDPSLNRATDGAARNLLGMAGASLADTLMQMVGLASIALFLPPAVWGITIACGERLDRLRQRLLLWFAGMLLIASTLSILPEPRSWLLTHGLGGMVGDFGQAFFVRLGGFFNPNFAGIIGAVISGYVGLWALVRSCGMGISDLRLLWHLPPRGSASRAAMASGFIYLYDRGVYFKDRLAQLLHREPRSPQRLPQNYWEEPDPVPRLQRQRPVRRAAEASFDPRFAGHEGEPARPAAASRRIPMRPAVMEEPAPVRDAKRIEPFFDPAPGFPAPDPGHRPVRIQPAHAPHRPAAPAARAEPYREAELYREAEPYAPPHAAYAAEPRAYPVPHAHAGAARPMPHAQGYDERNPHDYYPAERRGPPAPYQAEAYAGEDEDEDDYANTPLERDYIEPRRTPPPPPSPRAVPAHRAPAPKIMAVPVREEVNRFADFKMPSNRLLTPAPERRNNPELSDSALGRKAELLHGVLEDFGIKGTITGVHPGPVITLFELEPARGTKSARVIGLADDIARSMSAVSARVAVIPGRDAIGIELPNQNREMVFLRELLEAPDFAKGKGALPLALGKTIAGAPVIVDLARMPHLLIAGTTGSGKSVAINAMILSLLYRLSPEQCRFIMIDPKMLELSVYDDIPHLLTPVVTDPRKAITALKWTVGEMNVRYERMCKLGVRNITGFNQKVSRAKVQGRPLVRTVQTGFDEETGEAIYERENIDDTPMPYIVVVIDEMADLMMVAGKDIEYAVQRLSQMARAAGIHLIMATQRPSVDVITGTIKANFPSRVSFQVTSKIDSRTILGEQGAEQLLGAGDMLSMAAGGRIMRAHGPFVSDEEVERVVNFLKEQAEPEYLDGLLDDEAPSETKRGGRDNGAGDSGREPTGEDVYDQAVEIVLKERRATTSYLQRRLGIGYNRAASLIERMEQDGLISPPNRTGKREVLSGEAE